MFTKIRYRAKLRAASEIDHLFRELEEICQTNSWTYHHWDNDWTIPNSISLGLQGGAIQVVGHAPLKGITFQTGPEADSIWLTFTPDGILHSLLTLHDASFTADDEQFPWQRVKVRWGDTRTFISICNLFRFIGNKYCKEFQVLEETGYWLHRDPDRLKAFMDRMGKVHRQLEEEKAAIEADDRMDPKQKRKIIQQLLVQFGKQHPPEKG